MKIKKTLAAAFAALLIVSNSIPSSAQDPQSLQEETTTSDESASQQPTAETGEEPDSAVPDEVPAFHPEIKASFQNYMIEAILADSNLDANLVQPLYSLDGETYQDCGDAWDACPYGDQYRFKLYSNCEPLKSYLKETLDRFYLKLHVTKENGVTYETQAAVIDRGHPQPIPENISVSAMFSPDLAVIKTRPFDYYGGYQLTVSEHATAEEISVYLPDTLPVKINLMAGKNSFADGTVNCPVKWKPLSLPQLTGGECVTIRDAAEEIAVPEGTLVTTPMGIFQLDEPIPLDQTSENNPYSFTDEVRLILNVISDNENPTGALSEEHAGLETPLPLEPPDMGGAGGNQNNAGAGNKDDSTENGQRPNLPHTSESKPQITPKPDDGNNSTSSKNDSTENGQQSNNLPSGEGKSDTAKPTDTGKKPSATPKPEDTDTKAKTTSKPEDTDKKAETTSKSKDGEKKPEITAMPKDAEKHADPGSIKKKTGDGQQYATITANTEDGPRTTPQPNHAKNQQRQNFPQNLTTGSKTPIRPNLPGVTSSDQMPLNQRGVNMGQKQPPFMQFPAAAQPQAETSTEDRNLDSTANDKATFPAELAPSVSLQLEARASDAHHKPLLSAAVMAISGLFIAGIYFTANSRCNIGKSGILRKILLRK